MRFTICAYTHRSRNVTYFISGKGFKRKRLTPLFKNFTAPELSLSVVYASRQHLPRITQEFIAFMIEKLDFYLKPQN